MKAQSAYLKHIENALTRIDLYLKLNYIPLFSDNLPKDDDDQTRIIFDKFDAKSDVKSSRNETGTVMIQAITKRSIGEVYRKPIASRFSIALTSVIFLRDYFSRGFHCRHATRRARFLPTNKEPRLLSRKTCLVSARPCPAHILLSLPPCPFHTHSFGFIGEI